MGHVLPEHLKRLSESEVQQAIAQKDSEVLQEMTGLIDAYALQFETEKGVFILPACAIERIAFRRAFERITS